MSSELGAWLRQQREARNWSRREMARQLIQAGKACGDTSLPSVGSMYHNVRRWERGESGLTERYKLYYCKILSIPPERFGPHASSADALSPLAVTAPAPAITARSPALSSPTPVPPVASDRADPHLLAAIVVAYRGIYGSDMGGFPVEREVLMAAHEASDHAEQRGIADTTLEQLRGDVTRLARLSDTGEPLAVFLEMRRVRDQIYRLQDRRLGPGEQTDLYFLLGCLNGLMGNIVIRLGYPDAAEELIRAGWAYASAIDHRPLQGQLRTQLSSLMYWRGRFAEGRDLAADGLRYVSEGWPGADLHVNLAKSAARMGEADAARQAVRDAHEARQRDYTDELLQMGGQFAISEATHHSFAGAALAGIEGAEGEAAQELEQAIGLYDEGPRQGEDHWFAGKPLASLDLAVVRLRSGALDAAAEALEPAFSLLVGQRITQVTTRLAVVRDELAAPVFRGSAQARDLGEQIEEFGRETIVAGLHSLPGAPG
jgi:transcriptional regulator with XRE-family HTH domain